jgi:hypothetical protein
VDDLHRGRRPALRPWGIGRIAAATLLYWLTVVTVAIVRTQQAAHAATAAYEAAHPGAPNFVVTTTAMTWGAPGVLLLLLGPPAALVGVCLWARRRATG